MAEKKSEATKKRPQDVKKDLAKVSMAKIVGGAYSYKNSKGQTYGP